MVLGKLSASSKYHCVVTYHCVAPTPLKYTAQTEYGYSYCPTPIGLRVALLARQNTTTGANGHWPDPVGCFMAVVTMQYIRVYMNDV